MAIGSRIAKAFCLIAIVAEASAVGRRLRLRGLAESDAPGLQAANSLGRPPVIHFLFLAVDKVNNIGVWNSFFEQAPKEQYRAYVHCKVPKCEASVAGSPLVPIPVVPSFYCADLVTPMNQLLSEALRRSNGRTNPADKFIFVSDSTLPAKPFQQIYGVLAQRSGSDFCVASTKEWLTRRVQQPDGGAHKPVEMAVKHHQWSVLERGHAERVTQLWRAGPAFSRDFLMRFEMNRPPRARSVKTFAGSSDTGCLDEFYHMAAIYGTQAYDESFNESVVSMAEFTNSPLHIAATTGLQGSCDTFVAWPEYAKELSKNSSASGRTAFHRLYANLDPLSVPYTGDARKPGYWDVISSHGLRAIRASEFLFVRKFVDQPRIADGGNFGSLYPKLVF